MDSLHEPAPLPVIVVIFPLSRQSKDQNKKGPAIKLGQQAEKKGSGILPDPRKDNPMDNAKVCVSTAFNATS